MQVCAHVCESITLCAVKLVRLREVVAISQRLNETKESKETKERISVSLDPELLRWLDIKVEERIFANRSHGMEFLLKQQLDRECCSRGEG